MNQIEKSILLITLIISVAYIIAFNLNVPYYWSNEPRVVPDGILRLMWLCTFILGITALVLCIRDSGKRNLEKRASWIAYMVLIGAFGIPHYYFKHGRHARD